MSGQVFLELREDAVDTDRGGRCLALQGSEALIVANLDGARLDHARRGDGDLQEGEQATSLRVPAGVPQGEVAHVVVDMIGGGTL